MPEWQIYLLLMIVYAHICVAGSRMYDNISVVVGIDDSSTEVYTGINILTRLSNLRLHLPGGLA